MSFVVDLGANSPELAFGPLPAELQPLLGMFDGEAVLGTQLLEGFDLGFDLPRSMERFESLNSEHDTRVRGQ